MNQPDTRIDATDTTVADGKPKGVGRRRFMARVGATGLLTSAGWFAGTAMASDASAAPLCCSLAHYPANTTYTYCHAHAAYIWYCSVNSFLHCACCETAGNRLSAADCHYN
jgi:hypothetical protein